VPLPVSELGDVVTEISDQTGLAPALAEEPHFDDQLSLYDSLVHSDPGLTDAELTQYFKAESMRGPGDGPWERQRTVAAGDYRVDTKRDGSGVQHMFGDTPADALSCMGHRTAPARPFLLGAPAAVPVTAAASSEGATVTVEARDGEVLPDDALDQLRTFDAILLGAVGHPDSVVRLLLPAHAPETNS
jgi:hypothetical protein